MGIRLVKPAWLRRWRTFAVLSVRHKASTSKLRGVVVFGCVMMLLGVALRFWPATPLSNAFPSSRSVYASDGTLLRLTLASDEQYRLWVPISQLSPSYLQAVIQYEDRYFYRHLGVNPVALVRAAFTTLTGQRRFGGSTITMQLARVLYGIESHRPLGKLQQVLAAIWLECRYSKQAILEAYVNFAPYGNNVVGVGAASLVYFHKSPHALSWPESLNLAVIPQHPRKRLPTTQHPNPSGLEAARVRLWQSLKASGEAASQLRPLGNKEVAKEEAFDAALSHLTPAMLVIPFYRRQQLPNLAPHLVNLVLQTREEREVYTSLDVRMQSVLERLLTGYIQSRRDVGIQNASAMLLDASNMQVKAVMGSVDFHNADILGQVNGTLGKRSPGSTLKPFIYGLALDQGLIHSASVLKDAPSHFGVYSPENFDGRFSGPIPAQEALIRSRNIPAVSLSAKLQHPSLYAFLRMARVRDMQSEAHYGLALVLGGGELTMEELVQLYAMLPNQGVWKPLRYVRDDDTPSTPLRLLSPAASFIVRDMLSQTPRPDTFLPAKPAIAWKTGTSWGFRDAWTIGVVGRYVLAVWVGNFDGSSNPALVGIEAAAPAFMRIADALRAEKVLLPEPVSAMPADLKRIEVCTASGDIPNEACPAKSQAWFIAGKSPIQQSHLHQKIWVDTRDGHIECEPTEHTQAMVVAQWGSDMQSLFRQAGLPLKQWPRNPCQAGGQSGSTSVTIVLPLRGVTHLQRAQQVSSILLKAESSEGGEIYWFADKVFIAKAKAGETISWQAKPGRYRLQAINETGVTDIREVDIEMTQ